ncbi:MAG: hypothetical protein J0L92_06140 [Deltaproteobacteria bacterium]|nr:hypothetical protein [Deltaproteobacteria bacterium]
MDRLLLPLTAMLLGHGCVSTPRTELVVFVESDLARPDPLSRVTISVRHGERELGPFSDIVDPARSDARELPISLGLTNRTVGEDLIEITATAANRDGDVVSQSARVRFVPERARAICLRLDDACRGVVCAEGTCAAGRCIDASLDVDALPAIDAAGVDAFRCPQSSHTIEVGP